MAYSPAQSTPASLRSNSDMLSATTTPIATPTAKGSAHLQIIAHLQQRGLNLNPVNPAPSTEASSNATMSSATRSNAGNGGLDAGSELKYLQELSKKYPEEARVVFLDVDGVLHSYDLRNNLNRYIFQNTMQTQPVPDCPQSPRTVPMTLWGLDVFVSMWLVSI